MKTSTRMLGRGGLVAAALLFACGGSQKASPGAGAAGVDDNVKITPYPGFVIEGEAMEVHHGVGDAPAFINNVSILVRNTSGQARTVHVWSVERLHGSCDAPGWNEASMLHMTEPTGDIVIEPGEQARIAVVFDEVECYNACDRFGFRVSLEIDGVTSSVVAMLNVNREPMPYVPPDTGIISQ